MSDDQSIHKPYQYICENLVVIHPDRHRVFPPWSFVGWPLREGEGVPPLTFVRAIS